MGELYDLTPKLEKKQSEDNLERIRTIFENSLQVFNDEKVDINRGSLIVKFKNPITGAIQEYQGVVVSKLGIGAVKFAYVADNRKRISSVAIPQSFIIDAEFENK